MLAPSPTIANPARVLSPPTIREISALPGQHPHATTKAKLMCCRSPAPETTILLFQACSSCHHTDQRLIYRSTTECCRKHASQMERCCDHSMGFGCVLHPRQPTPNAESCASESHRPCRLRFPLSRFVLHCALRSLILASTVDPVGQLQLLALLSSADQAPPRGPSAGGDER